MLILRRIFHPLLVVCLIPSLLGGCHHPTDSESLVGHWHGQSHTGSVSVPVEEQFRRNGMETITVTLPQGTLIAEGTWTLRSGVLTQVTTTRATMIAGQQKKVTLGSPMEVVYHSTLAGDQLTLTRPEMQETIRLMRDVK